MLCVVCVSCVMCAVGQRAGHALNSKPTCTKQVLYPAGIDVPTARPGVADLTFKMKKVRVAVKSGFQRDINPLTDDSHDPTACPPG